ncbi:MULTISPECIES: hypothetical protein [unclassified Halomonas]|uniref:hypothetical protein n=1 Tax=unclassified Halomonas TaxID=2609666 RepID=UPI003CE7094C
MSWSIKYIKDERSFSRWGGLSKTYFSLNEFENESCINSGCYSIYESGALIDINLDALENKPLLVFFNGAKNRNNDTKLPIFSGAKVTPIAQASRLSINDPSLYLGDDISMGWYAGGKNIPLQSDILPRLIKKIVGLLKSTALIFVGGSAGGFASLYYSRKIPGSICVTSNPQTSIFNYYKSHVNRYLKYSFDIDDVQKVKENPKITKGTVTNLCRYYNGETSSKIIYLQNLLDKHHVNRHHIPFIQSFGHEPALEVGVHHYNDNLVTFVGDWGDGHKTAPREFWSTMLSNVVNKLDNLDDIFKERKVSKLFE